MRTVITPTPITGNSATFTDPAGVAADSANGMAVVGVQTEKLLIRIANAGGSQTTATVRSNGQPSPNGDLTTAVTAGSTRWLGPFTSSQYQQTDNYQPALYVDFSSATSITITAFELPKAV